MAEADEEPVEVVVSRLLDLVPLDRYELHRELLAGAEVVQVEAKRTHVGGELLRAFFERDDEARLFELDGAADHELQSEDGLPASGPAGNQRGPSAGKTSLRHGIETGDSGRCLGQRLDPAWLGRLCQSGTSLHASGGGR